MSRTKAAKAKATRSAKARAVQASRTQALEAKTLALTPAPTRKSRLRTMFSLRVVRDSALTVGAITGVVCMLLAVAALAFDVRPVIFRSGSMSPAIDTGALAISKSVDAKDLAIGDVVTVKTGAGVRVTHRIQDLSLANGKATLVLRGDANGVADERAYVVKTADRVLFDIPKAGYVVSWASGPVGIFAGGLLVGLLMLTAFGPGSRTNKPGTPKANDRRMSGVVVATLALGVFTTGAAGTQQTQAYYTDSAAMTSGTFDRAAAPVVPAAPAVISCIRHGNDITLSWAALTNPTSFQVRFTPALGFAPQTVGGTLRTYTTTSVNLNNLTGQIWMVAINAVGTSSDSNRYNFTGNGTGGATCLPAP